ncbi:MAG TPA: hypothetical protein VF491_18290, partial [Vicinamibacterales bacterium]
MAIARGDPQAKHAVEICRWLPGQDAICKAEPYGQGAAVDERDREGQRIAIDVRKCSGLKDEAEGLVFGTRQIGKRLGQDRSVIDRIDDDRKLPDDRSCLVRRQDFQRYCPIEIGRRRAGERPGRAIIGQPGGQGSAADTADLDKNRVAIDIGNEGGWQGRRERLVLGPPQGRDRADHRHIVHRSDRDRDPGDVGDAGGIGDLIVEPGIAVEVGIGRDDELADAVRGDRQAVRVDDAAEDKCLVVGLDVILEQLGDEQRQRRLIFAERQSVVARDRRVVDRQDLNLDSGRDRESGGVRDRIAEQQCAMEVCRRRDPILPILECRDRSIGRCADEAEEGDRLAFRIVVIRKKLGRIDVDIGVFERAEPMVGHRDRNVELRQDGERHPSDAVGAVSVGHAIGEGGVAEIALAGREDGGVAVHGNGAIVAIEQFDDCEAVALDVTIVGKQPGEVDDERRILVADEDAFRIVAGAHAVRIGVRRIVD